MPSLSSVVRSIVLLAVYLSGSSVAAQTVRLSSSGVVFNMQLQDGRYSFAKNGRSVVGPDASAGILLDRSPVRFQIATRASAMQCVLTGTSATGKHLRLTILMSPHKAELIVEPEEASSELRFQTAGAKRTGPSV